MLGTGGALRFTFIVIVTILTFLMCAALQEPSAVGDEAESADELTFTLSTPLSRSLAPPCISRYLLFALIACGHRRHRINGQGNTTPLSVFLF